MKSWRAPAMVVAIVRDAAVVHLAAYETANVETGKPMTADMLVSVASVAKTVTSATALTLATEAKLDLDAPIRTYLPWLPPQSRREDRTPRVAPDTILRDGQQVYPNMLRRDGAWEITAPAVRHFSQSMTQGCCLTNSQVLTGKALTPMSSRRGPRNLYFASRGLDTEN